MSETIRLDVDTSSLSENLRAASAEVSDVVQQEMLPAAQEIEDAFATVARSIESELAKAARNGSLSLKSLAQSVASDLAGVAIKNFITKPIENLFTNAFGGARANGGAVMPGAGFLVGERGPEVFVPSSSGHIMPQGAGNVTLNLNLGQTVDAQSFRKSEPQIAISLQRALARAQRNS